MLVDYSVTEMGFLNDYSDAAPQGKSMRGNGITTFILHFDQCIISMKQIALKQHLFLMNC